MLGGARHAAAAPAPLSQPGQDLRAGDVQSDIAFRHAIAPPVMAAEPLPIRSSLDADLRMAASRLDRPGGLDDLRGTTKLRALPDQVPDPLVPGVEAMVAPRGETARDAVLPPGWTPGHQLVAAALRHDQL